jgi:hypothetical protein
MPQTQIYRVPLLTPDSTTMPQTQNRLVIIWDIKGEAFNLKALQVSAGLVPHDASLKLNRDINPTHDPHISISFSKSSPDQV